MAELHLPLLPRHAESLDIRDIDGHPTHVIATGTVDC